MSCHVAAIDGHSAASTISAAADASSITTSAGCHVAAIDGHVAASTIIAATDASYIITTSGSHVAAIDGHVAAIATISAATDASIIKVSNGIHFAHVCALAMCIDVQGLSLSYSDTLLGIQGGPVAENDTGRSIYY